MNLKVGDKVRIREDLKLREYRSSDSTYEAIVVHKMMEYKGKIATIKRIHYAGIGIDLDNGKWCWADTMFEEIEKEKVNEVIFNKPSFIHNDVEKVIRNGNCVVVILDTGEKGVAKLHSDDKFDLKTGYEISYQRATIKRLKNEIKNEEYILNIKKGKIIETHNKLLKQFVNNSMNILGNMK